MDNNRKISDLTVAEFRKVMQACFDADRSMVARRENDFLSAIQNTGHCSYDPGSMRFVPDTGQSQKG